MCLAKSLRLMERRSPVREHGDDRDVRKRAAYSNVADATAKFFWERVEHLRDYLDKMFAVHPSPNGTNRHALDCSLARAAETRIGQISNLFSLSIGRYHNACMKRVLVSWSSGKDSAWTLHLLRQRGDCDIVGLLATLNTEFDRVAMHSTRRSVLEAQAKAAGLPLWIVPLLGRAPTKCTNRG